MDIIRIVGIGIAAIIIAIIIKQYKPEFSIYISLLAGVIILSLVVGKLGEIINLLNNLANKTNVDKSFLLLLIKITGISILAEFGISICKDAGETAIANKVDLGRKNTNYVYVYTDNIKYVRNNFKDITIEIVTIHS